MEKIWLKHYDSGVEENIDMEKVDSLADMLEKSFVKYKDKPAFHNMGKTLTYSEIKDKSLDFASYLQNDLGLEQGSRVGLMMPNILQYPIALYGILQAGMVAVNFNPLYTERELEHQLNDSGCEVLVVFTSAAHLIEKVAPRTKLKKVILTELGDQLGFPKSHIVNFVIKYVKKMVPAYNLPRAIKFNDALAYGDRFKFKKPYISIDDLAFLQYTGGTTGVSKGAMLTHKNIRCNIMQVTEWFKYAVKEGEEIAIVPLPLYHIFSLTANCLFFTNRGFLSVLITNPRDMPAFIAELKKWPFTILTGVNTLFNSLLNQEDFKTVDFSTVKLCLGGGMAVQEPVAKEWKKVTGVALIEGYGLTETSPVASVNLATLEQYSGGIGRPVPSTEMAIFGDNGEKLAVGEVGEIGIKGPQVMKGYWGKADATKEVMNDDGYFLTGDIGVVDETGFFKIVDRKKDMILVSGFNVYPNELEEVVAGHPKVLEAAAIGVPDAKSGEAVKMFVVRKDDSLTKEELKAYCKEHLTGYKVPKLYEFRDDLPKTNVGKILRRELRDN